MRNTGSDVLSGCQSYTTVSPSRSTSGNANNGLIQSGIAGTYTQSSCVSACQNNLACSVCEWNNATDICSFGTIYSYVKTLPIDAPVTHYEIFRTCNGKKINSTFLFTGSFCGYLNLIMLSLRRKFVGIDASIKHAWLTFFVATFPTQTGLCCSQSWPFSVFCMRDASIRFNYVNCMFRSIRLQHCVHGFSPGLTLTSSPYIFGRKNPDRILSRNTSFLNLPIVRSNIRIMLKQTDAQFARQKLANHYAKCAIFYP